MTNYHSNVLSVPGCTGKKKGKSKSNSAENFTIRRIKGGQWNI